MSYFPINLFRILPTTSSADAILLSVSIISVLSGRLIHGVEECRNKGPGRCRGVFVLRLIWLYSGVSPHFQDESREGGANLRCGQHQFNLHGIGLYLQEISSNVYKISSAFTEKKLRLRIYIYKNYVIETIYINCHYWDLKITFFFI